MTPARSAVLLLSVLATACGEASSTPAASSKPAPPAAPAPAGGTAAAPAAGAATKAPAAAASPAAAAKQAAAAQTAGAQATATKPAGLPQMPPRRELSTDEFDRYLAAVKDVRALGQDIQDRPATDAGDMQDMFQGLQDVAQFNGVVGEHGFDQAGFLDVHYNVVWSYAALELDAQQAEMDQAKAEQEAALEKMKGMMSEQQIAALKAQLDTANAQLDALRDVPPANKALVAARRQEFEAAIGKDG